VVPTPAIGRRRQPGKRPFPPSEEDSESSPDSDEEGSPPGVDERTLAPRSDDEAGGRIDLTA